MSGTITNKIQIVHFLNENQLKQKELLLFQREKGLIDSLALAVSINQFVVFCKT